MSFSDLMERNQWVQLRTNVNSPRFQTFCCSSLQLDRICMGKVILQMLKIKKGSRMNGAQSYQKVAVGVKESVPGKSRRMSEPYDRLSLTRDITDGSLVYVISKTKKEGLTNFKDSSIAWPGDVFVAMHPTYIFRIGTIRVLCTDEPFIRTAVPEDLVVPEVHVGPQWASGAFLKAVHYENVKIRMDLPKLDEATCGGIMCDGQHKDVEKCPSLCIAPVPARMMKTHVTVLETNVICVPFISRKSTEVFVSPAVMIADNGQVDMFDYMDRVEEIVEFYNDHGGWTVSGWYKPSYEAEGGRWVEPALHLCNVFPMRLSGEIRLYELAPVQIQHGDLELAIRVQAPRRANNLPLPERAHAAAAADNAAGQRARHVPPVVDNGVLVRQPQGEGGVNNGVGHRANQRNNGIEHPEPNAEIIHAANQDAAAADNEIGHGGPEGALGPNNVVRQAVAVPNIGNRHALPGRNNVVRQAVPALNNEVRYAAYDDAPAPNNVIRQVVPPRAAGPNNPVRLMDPQRGPAPVNNIVRVNAPQRGAAPNNVVRLMAPQRGPAPVNNIVRVNAPQRGLGPINVVRLSGPPAI